MVFATKEQAHREIVKYIEGFYNRKRLHSGVELPDSLQVYTAWLNDQLAA